MSNGFCSFEYYVMLGTNLIWVLSDKKSDISVIFSENAHQIFFILSTMVEGNRGHNMILV